MWVGRDEFQFAWKKLKGDFLLRTRTEFAGQGAAQHRKIGWMVRPSLSADAPYADCARHGVDLTSLQFRRSAGAITEQITLPLNNPDILQFERKGTTYIDFNSSRTGRMQLWRMKPDGKDQEQVTDDEYNNWFPHISPDGKWIAFISFPKEINPADHPYYKHVYLRLMPAAGGPAKVIAYVYGGQGTMNVPSWSPDSQKIAFVSNTDLP